MEFTKYPDDEHDAARIVLAHCPEIKALGRPCDRTFGGYDASSVERDLASMIRREAREAFGGDLDSAVAVTIEHLQGRSGELSGDPRKPGDVLRHLVNFRALRVWCWHARFEATRIRMIDYLRIVVENDGDAYRMRASVGDRAAAGVAIRNAWQAIETARAFTGADEDLDVPADLVRSGVRLSDVRGELTEMLLRHWAA